LSKYWCIPKENDAAFITNMEDVLGIYQKPYNVHHPVICMDEKPVQLLDEITGNKGVIFATGTPISNSMTEMFTLIKVIFKMPMKAALKLNSQFCYTLNYTEISPLPDLLILDCRLILKNYHFILVFCYLYSAVSPQPKIATSSSA
jgi:hypothetical protein